MKTPQKLSIAIKEKHEKKNEHMICVTVSYEHMENF